MFVSFAPTRDVFARLDALARQVDAAGGARARRGSHRPGAPSPAGRAWQPQLEVAHAPEGWTLSGDLPGFAREDVQVTFEDGVLAIRGQPRAEGVEGVEVVRRERQLSAFAVQLRFTEPVDVAGIAASLKEGVLTVSVPRASRPRQVTVEVRA